MSIPHRLWRLAQQRVKDGLGRLDEGTADARRELDEFMRRGPQPRPDRQSPPGTPPRPASPPHPLEREYRVLDAPAGSDLAVVKSAWRKLVRENHPDRFPEDPDARAAAAERLRRINEAYHRLRDHLSKTE
jgi:DnaJ-class molecular chaperone